MLTLHQAFEIRESLLAYLKATFDFQDKELHKAFFDFVEDPTEGMFKGPYISLKTSFEKVDTASQEAVPLEIKPSWPAYDHQVKSWQRLSCRDKEAEPTIVTTGTGSGKTESFLYPILDYCQLQQHRQGIKVIILYPMNALASDQAKRIAEAIDEDDRLRGKVTAGLFIGEGESQKQYPTGMGKVHIIENRKTILDSPPDILLTNFKMLDYGLMKANYHDLWIHNLQDPSLLKFLVLDELHTYDGAQGTDVANLIRRLKLKLNIEAGQLCPVGTSATIGSGEDAPQLLADYASKIFDAKITREAIIGENRVKAESLFGTEESLEAFIPRIHLLKDAIFQKNESLDDYLDRQKRLWQLQAEPEKLLPSLQQQLIVKQLVSICNQGKGIHHIEDIEVELERINPEFKKIPQWDAKDRFNPRRALLESLFALISSAKLPDKRKSPFLYAQVQLWVRELSGLLRSVEEKKRFVWRNEVDPVDDAAALPPWFCRECGASGWLGVKHENKERFERDINDVYEKFFSNHKNLYFLQLQSEMSLLEVTETGYEPSDFFEKKVTVSKLLFEKNTTEETVDLLALRKLNDNNRAEHYCPACNTRNTIAIIGTRVATMSSIAMSQTLATELDPQAEQNRKVLAFTNAVQDAAHQAGFIEARNYRFTLRASLQRVINGQYTESISLKDLADAFIDYWKAKATESGKQLLDAYYHRFFPKDYIGKSAPDDYKVKDSYLPEFQREFDTRVRWEIYGEFSYDALIGRTLEKTGSSAAFFNAEALEKTWGAIAPWLETNTPAGSIKKEDFIRFLVLLLHRVRGRGGLSHPYLEKFRSQNLKLWDLNWQRDSRHFLNKNYGPNVRFPRLLTPGIERKGLLDSSYTRNRNWFHNYFGKSFPLVSGHQDFRNEFFQKLFEAFVDAGVMDKRSVGDLFNYAIRPEVVLVAKQVVDLICDTCEHILHTGDITATGTGGSCIRFRCKGHYRPKKEMQAVNYYQAVYNRSKLPRIYAADHTGLLDRDDREQLEADFKQQPNYNSVNALVATSTLEMGIDIGSLNTAYNNSVPPLPSNFLQRVGRAGRSTGSALIVNFVQNKAHDLFYFQEPKDMMAGDVNTPGCYLEAKEILRRHFFAASIDAWSSLNHKEHTIPLQIRFLKIETLNLQDESFFLNKILNFIKANETELLEKFKARYDISNKEEVFDQLKGDLQNESFYTFHQNIFKKLKDEIKGIRRKQKDIEDLIKTLKLGKEDPERLELEQEKKKMGGIIRAIKKRNILEHLTNAGALPNYAFPETGVTMMAQIFGYQAEGSEKIPEPKEYEIVRPPIQALREFAPDNNFYSQGYRFQVSGVETFDWADRENFHEKRFCSACDHIMDDAKAPKGNCPKCGDESWRSTSNVHRFAKLNHVKSFNSKHKATLSDNKDDREAEMYWISRHFNFDSTSSKGAFANRDIPFGIEFVKHVQLTEVNMGRMGEIDARRVILNEHEVAQHGFITCRACGKSTSHLSAQNQRDFKFHYGYCKHKEHKYAGQPDEVFQEVFFYREMSTEALKILLPVQEFNSVAEVNMFKAGIELGLKKYFRGNPQHVAISEYREYNKKSLRFDRYLVLYDKVPGGTGYLDQLFSKEAFGELLQRAYAEIQNCGCQHRGKDGCYRCIFSYSNQYYQQDLSRERAEKRFEDVVGTIDGWEHQVQGLADVSGSGQIEESELEDRFLRSLRNFAKLDTNKWSFNEENQGIGISYTLTWEDGDNKLSYFIRPQVDLGPAHGIQFHTRADFLITCTQALFNGKDRREAVPKFAIYLDGYQYHASELHNRFATDLQKRMAILANSAYRTWILSWGDMERFDAGLAEEKDLKKQSDFLHEKGFDPQVQANQKKLKSQNNPLHHQENSMVRLMRQLEGPFEGKGFRRSRALFLAGFQKSLLKPSFAPDQWTIAFSLTNSPLQYCLDQKTLNGLIPFEGLDPNELFEARTLVNIEAAEIRSQIKLKFPDEIDKTDWEQFWIYFNLIQFFPIEQVGEFGGAEIQEDSIEEENKLATELIPFFEEEYAHIIKVLCEQGHIQSEEDELALNELTDEQGHTLAMAEFIIPHLQVVFEPGSDAFKTIFEKAGFTILSKTAAKDYKI